MDFITIDFETATPERNSPCEIGLTFVENNQIKEVKSWLIKPICYPYFDDFCVSIHGITPKDVKNSPEFVELWKEIEPLIKHKFLIAHNAGFDMSVLRRTMDTYKIKYPELNYACSYIFAKKVWQGLSDYGLATLCRHNNIPLDHHRAAADSEATAKLAVKAFEIVGVNCIEDFPEKLRTTIGRISGSGYKPCETMRETKRETKPRNITGDPQKHNPESIFFGRTVVFTGTLSSMPRHEAQQIIADIGGINGGGVTKETDFLVVGQQDYRLVGEDGMSNKQEKAIKLIEQGAELEVISEDEFLKNL
ncbi:MAG TPA: exonuclease domain-containing protein [Tenuifilaceae bacterium]|nr:exonuclease domain-containing protein [Tenuifilaceae bacterium]